MKKVLNAPVVGRDNPVEPRSISKWSRRGRVMRYILLAVFKVVGMIVSVFRIVRWLYEYLL